MKSKSSWALLLLLLSGIVLGGFIGEIEERTVDEDITVVFEYPYLNGIMRIVKEDNPAIISQKFEMDCEMTLRIRKGEAERLKNRLLKVETAYLKE